MPQLPLLLWNWVLPALVAILCVVLVALLRRRGSQGKVTEGQVARHVQQRSVHIGRQEATITADESAWIDIVLEATPFKDWVNAIGKQTRVEVSKIHIQSVDMFGSKIGFIKFKADVKVDSKIVPGIVFMRGGAVAILVILYHSGRRYALIVRQPRVPVGHGNLPEIPAGILDGNGNFAGVAAKELEEEVGIIIKQSDLIDMTSLAYKDGYPGVFPSCGGSDEFNRIFLFEKKINTQEFNDLNGKLTGVAEEGEMIKLQIIPFESLWRISPDAKILAALALYERLNIRPLTLESRIKHVYFDFDQTITRPHVYHALSAKGSRVETGQVHKLQQLDASGSWKYDMQEGVVEVARGDSWSIAALGGVNRVALLREFFSNLKEANAKLSVITKGNVGTARYILTQANLLDMFEIVYGNVGMAYGPTEFDKNNSAPTGYEGQPENELKSTKVQLIALLMQQNGATFDDAVLVEDDKDEVASVACTCRSVYVTQRKGMTPYEMNTILEMAGLPRVKVPVDSSNH